MVGSAVETMVASSADSAMAHISAATSSVLRSWTRAEASEFVSFTFRVYVRCESNVDVATSPPPLSMAIWRGELGEALPALVTADFVTFGHAGFGAGAVGVGC